MKNIHDLLKDHIRSSGQTVNAIAVGAGIPVPVVSRFVNGVREHLRSDTVDKLLKYFNLEIRPKK